MSIHTHTPSKQIISRNIKAENEGFSRRYAATKDLDALFVWVRVFFLMCWLTSVGLSATICEILQRIREQKKNTHTNRVCVTHECTHTRTHTHVPIPKESEYCTRNTSNNWLRISRTLYVCAAYDLCVCVCVFILFAVFLLFILGQNPLNRDHESHRASHNRCRSVRRVPGSCCDMCSASQWDSN